MSGAADVVVADGFTGNAVLRQSKERTWCYEDP